VKTFSLDSIVETADKCKILLSASLHELAGQLDDARGRARDFSGVS